MDNLVRAALEIEQRYSGEDAGLVASAFLAIRETLRDRFAMVALQGLLANTQYDQSCKEVVRLAYRLADEALEARKEER